MSSDANPNINEFDYGHEDFGECHYCEMHSFPCLKCSLLVYHGTLGPGFLNGKRQYIKNLTLDEDIIKNIKAWIHNHPDQIVVHSETSVKNTIPCQKTTAGAKPQP